MMVKCQIYARIPPRGVPNMKFPRRNGGEGNFYKWLPARAGVGRWFVSERFSQRPRVAKHTCWGEPLASSLRDVTARHNARQSAK